MCRILSKFVFLAFTLMVLALSGAASAQEATPVEPQSEVLAPLLDVLEDDTARQELVDALRNANSSDNATSSEEQRTLAAQLAVRAAAFVTDIRNQIGQSLRDVGRLALLPELLTEERVARIRDEAPALALTIFLTALVYRGIRFASRRIVRGGTTAERAGLGAFLAQFMLRILSVVVAGVIGFALSPLFSSGPGLAVSQSLYLSAFFAFGLFTVVLSIFVSKYPEDVTFSGLGSKPNAAIYKNTRLTVGVLIYGLMAAVPIMQEWVNFVAARSFRTTILLLSSGLAVWTIWRISSVLETKKLQQIMQAAREREEDSFSEAIAQRSLSLWDRFWPVLGYVYVAVATLIALARPNVMVEFVGRATLMTALALVAVLGGLRLFAISTAGAGFPLPDALKRILPTLQTRLSSFTTPVLVLGGVALLVTAVLLMLEGWQLVDVQSWLLGQGADLLWRIASVLLILAALILTWVVLASWIDKKLMVEGGWPSGFSPFAYIVGAV